MDTDAPLRIEELAPDSAPVFFETILSSFGFNTSAAHDARAEFARECREIGSNRRIYGGWLGSEPASIGQLILISADNDPDLADGRDIAHMHSLWVRKDRQRLGFGRLMAEGLALSAKSLGFKVLTLGVDSQNEPAVRLYQALGYQTFKTEPGRIPEDRLLLMRKEL
jgi:ribosomal protein S18 acetylase RimI-like enzyme